MDTKRILYLAAAIMACGCLAWAFSQARQHQRDDQRPMRNFDMVVRVAGMDAEDEGAAQPVHSDGLSVRALPARPGGKVQIAFHAPSRIPGHAPGDLTVEVDDVSGRRVAQLAAGAMPVEGEMITVAWDGKETGGDDIAPGVYFVRAAAPSVGFHTERRIVVR